MCFASDMFVAFGAACSAADPNVCPAPASLEVAASDGHADPFGPAPVRAVGEHGDRAGRQHLPRPGDERLAIGGQAARPPVVADQVDRDDLAAEGGVAVRKVFCIVTRRITSSAPGRAARCRPARARSRSR
jgi:hypothetical protein